MTDIVYFIESIHYIVNSVNLLIKFTEFTFKRIIPSTTVTEINGLSQPTFRKDPEYLKPPDDLKKKNFGQFNLP